ncbi:MAG: glycerate kinase [Desulfobacteraceae bacterium]|jgi:hydroxypyruvate reductase
MAKPPADTPYQSGPHLSQLRQDAETIFHAALKAVSPSNAMRRYCSRRNDRLLIGDRSFEIGAYRNIWIVGAGKATAAMAQVMEDLLGENIDGGLISVKYDHTAPLQAIDTIEAGHPIPDAPGQSAASKILALAQKAGKNDLVIVLLSGGGSSLLPLPIQGITLEEKQETSNILIGCGATIHEINAIRKHISAIKGGRLAQAAYPATVATLILSDVVGDDLDVIASGPTVPDSSTFRQCEEIIQRYDLSHRLPRSVVTHISNGAAGIIAETPKPTDDLRHHLHHQIVGSNTDAIAAAAAKAKALGYHTLILSSRMEGETRTVAQVHGAIAREILASRHPLPSPACLLSGGETTVTLRGDGVGGRNQEFALAAALDIRNRELIVVLSGGTDGTDGPTDAAGAISDHTTIERGKKAGLDYRQHLENNDAYPFFKELKDLLITGPTQTNVMDLHIILVEHPPEHSSPQLNRT